MKGPSPEALEGVRRGEVVSMLRHIPSSLCSCTNWVEEKILAHFFYSKYTSLAGKSVCLIAELIKFCPVCFPALMHCPLLLAYYFWVDKWTQQLCPFNEASKIKWSNFLFLHSRKAFLCFSKISSTLRFQWPTSIALYFFPSDRHPSTQCFPRNNDDAFLTQAQTGHHGNLKSVKNNMGV